MRKCKICIPFLHSKLETILPKEVQQYQDESLSALIDMILRKSI